MRIAIFGLGYVGVVSAACLASRGHTVVGVDVNERKIGMINAGRSPIAEPNLAPLLCASAHAGTLRATTDWEAAVADTDMAWVCVGTPSRASGCIDLDALRLVCEQIGKALQRKDDQYVVVLRSTVLPGTTATTAIPILEQHSGKTCGIGFGVCYQPEFFREGNGIEDFNHPSRIVIGGQNSTSRDFLSRLYDGFGVPCTHTTIETAELIKYCDNAWHAMKVAFANEIGTLAREMGVDGRSIMQLFVQDKRLNISGKYLVPGGAFGGSCLPKDLRALTYATKRADIELPLLDAVLLSNEKHMLRALRLIMEQGNRRVGLLGLSFKPGTDDLRESPLVEIAERLIGKGYDLRIFDPDIAPAMLVGSNLAYVTSHIPHLSKLLVNDLDALIDHAETLVIARDHPEYGESLERTGDDRAIVDLLGVRHGTHSRQHYHGICW
jgi:GDP-mannose 6-dehydrogenase